MNSIKEGFVFGLSVVAMAAGGIAGAYLAEKASELCAKAFAKKEETPTTQPTA